MQNGIFRGIENGEMKIEYEVSTYVNRRVMMEKRVFSYPAGGNSRRDTFFRGFGPREGTIGFRPDMPSVGQTVAWAGPSPDMAGHLMVDVYPVEEVA